MSLRCRGSRLLGGFHSAGGTQDLRPGPFSAVPAGLVLLFVCITQEFLLGYFQPSLRDWSPSFASLKLAAAAGGAAAHAAIAASVANHDGSAGMAAGGVAHVKVLPHGVGGVEDGACAEDAAVFDV